ncbi:MAG: hypothetical protein KDN22_13970 [Verrucomicrobiae bacterium]|nr:hypothetical protein [Verrucomicrobiae bacterium]
MDKHTSTHTESGNDAGFDQLLRSANLEVPLPGAFQSEVWRRIAVARESTLTARLAHALESLLSSLAQPVAASVLVFATISAGLWFGARSTEPGHDAKLAYVQSVSPFVEQPGADAP